VKILPSLLFLGVLTSPAAGQTLKPLCPDRGAIQPCIVDPGHVQVEVSITDWFDDADSTLLLGDTVVRYGLSGSTEIQLAVSPWVRKGSRIGQNDLKINVRHNILDGQLSAAIQPMVVIPTGSRGISQELFGAGVALAVTYDLSSETQLYISPTVFALPFSQVSGAIGVNQTIVGPFGAAVELFAQHNREQTQVSFDVSGTWTADSNTELDLNANIGLTQDTPALELILGISRRF
jgi:hypothetical protein